jgi:hypothetical protein
MARARSLTLKKEVLAELTPDELRSVVAGDLQAISDPNPVCAAISLSPAGGCLNLTCGPGCTGRSTVVKTA